MLPSLLCQASHLLLKSCLATTTNCHLLASVGLKLRQHPSETIHSLKKLQVSRIQRAHVVHSSLTMLWDLITLLLLATRTTLLASLSPSPHLLPQPQMQQKSAMNMRKMHGCTEIPTSRFKVPFLKLISLTGLREASFLQTCPSSMPATHMQTLSLWQRRLRSGQLLRLLALHSLPRRRQHLPNQCKLLLSSTCRHSSNLTLASTSKTT